LKELREASPKSHSKSLEETKETPNFGLKDKAKKLEKLKLELKNNDDEDDDEEFMQ